MAGMHRFEPDRYYRTSDPALRIIGTMGSMAVLRHLGRGPRYTKLGNRVFYRGEDLNIYLDKNIVEPTN